MTDKNELPDGTLSKSTAKRVEALAASGGEVKPEPSPKQCRERVERVCERSRYPNYREVLVGYRVVTRYPNGRTVETFEPVR